MSLISHWSVDQSVPSFVALLPSTFRLAFPPDDSEFLSEIRIDKKRYCTENDIAMYKNSREWYYVVSLQQLHELVSDNLLIR